MSKSKQAAATVLEEAYQVREVTAILHDFFDAFSYKSVDEVLSTVLYDYIAIDQENTIHVTNTVNAVRLIKNLVLELSLVHSTGLASSKMSVAPETEKPISCIQDDKTIALELLKLSAAHSLSFKIISDLYDQYYNLVSSKQKDNIKTPTE